MKKSSLPKPLHEVASFQHILLVYQLKIHLKSKIEQFSNDLPIFFLKKKVNKRK